MKKANSAATTTAPATSDLVLTPDAGTVLSFGDEAELKPGVLCVEMVELPPGAPPGSPPSDEDPEEDASVAVVLDQISIA